LLEAKLIEEVDVRENAKVGQERRRYYRLTTAGRKLARSEAERLADLLRVARTKKILRGRYV
jgi:DNA-binding PadR family transcriptional regulator